MTIIKKIACLSLVALSFSQFAEAQVDRTKYPVAQAAPVINIKDAETFTLSNGLKVFVVSNHKLPRVTISFSLLKTPTLLGDKAGLTDLFGTVFKSGTTTKTKDEIDEAVDRIGASMNFSSNGGSINYLKKYQSQAISLFSDVLLHPSFPEEEVKKAETKIISNLAAAKDNPDAISSNVVGAVTYSKKHPYGEVTTERSVANVTAADLVNYYDTYFRPNISYLAIVGDITKAEAQKLAEANFGKWVKKDVPATQLIQVNAPEKTEIALVNRPSSVQSVINISYPVNLALNDPNIPAVSLLSYIFGGGSSSRLFLNLRESKGYTYGAYGSISPDRYVSTLSAEASVRTAVTDSAIHELVLEMNRIKQNTITEEELREAKAYLTGNFGRSLESPSTLANFAINIEKNNLPKDYYKNYIKNLNAVTVDQLNELAIKYFNPEQAHIVVVGNTDEFADKLTRFGHITYYTTEGDVFVKQDLSKIELSAADIVKKYLTAIGGETKLASINKFKQVAEASFQGMTIQNITEVDRTNKVGKQETLLNGNPVSIISVNGDQVALTAMGQEQPIDDATKTSLLKILDIFPDLNYLKATTTLTLKGVEKINGQDAYHIVAEVNGNVQNEYYSVASGLKLQSKSPEIGEITFEEYGDVQGIKIPVVSTVISPSIPAPLKMVVKETLIN